MRPPFSFCSWQKENGPRPVQEKKRFGGSVRTRADLQPPAKERWLSCAAVRDGNVLPLGGSFGPGKTPDTVCFLFPLPLPCRFAKPYLPPNKAQANLAGQTFRQSPRGLHQTHNRGARPAQLSSPARAGRRPPNLCWHIFRNLSYISKPARRCRFCARRPFLLDRARPVFFSARSKENGGRIVASNLAFPHARTGTLPRPTPPKGANLWALTR